MDNGQIFFPFRKDQNYGIAWINMLLVFHELSLQGVVMLHKKVLSYFPPVILLLPH